MGKAEKNQSVTVSKSVALASQDHILIYSGVRGDLASRGDLPSCLLTLSYRL